jgi:5'-nucleotidase
MVGKTAIVQAYAYGKFLGALDVTFDDKGEIVSASGEPLIMDKAVAEDEATVGRIAELAQPLDEIRNKVVAESAEAIEGNRDICRQIECTMGNLVADASLDRVKDQGVAIALVNSGGLRASIDAGPVTMGEVLTVLPFQNTLSTFEISGKVLLEALENGVSQYEEKAGRFLQVAGMKYSFNPTLPAGSRITGAEVQAADGSWQPVDAAASYLVVANNYVRTGGDGFKMFVDAAKAYDFGPDLADVVAEYLAKAGPYKPYTDGRIVKE